MCASSTLFARRSALIQFLHRAGALFQFPPEEIALKLNHKKKLRVPISAGEKEFAECKYIPGAEAALQRPSAASHTIPLATIIDNYTTPRRRGWRLPFWC